MAPGKQGWTERSGATSALDGYVAVDGHSDVTRLDQGTPERSGTAPIGGTYLDKRRGPPVQDRRAFDEWVSRVGYLRTMLSKLLAPLKLPFMLGLSFHSATWLVSYMTWNGTSTKQGCTIQW